MKCPYLNKKECPILSNNLQNIHICEGYLCEFPVYVYVVRCNDDTLYTGFTRDIDRRMSEHKVGRGSQYCKSHGFKEYTYIQCGDAGDGMKIEKKIKQWPKEKKEKLFQLYGIYR